jgi:hypothetical protein
LIAIVANPRVPCVEQSTLPFDDKPAAAKAALPAPERKQIA